MGSRILGIELRRSAALPAALVIAAVGAFVLVASNPPYRSWMQLVVVQRDILQLTWPLALAAGAWQARRERRCRVEELVATTPRPRRWRVLPVAGAMAIAVVAAYLAMLAGAAGHLRHVDAYFPYGAVPLIGLGALSMVAAVWLGLAIGSLLPAALTAPMLAVSGFVALALSPMLIAGDRRNNPGTFLLLPYLQGPRDGGYGLQMLSARANLSQALWLVAVAATGLALFAAARRRARVAALVPVLLGAAIAVPAMPRGLDAAWIDDGRAVELVCTPDEPPVCLARLHSHALGHVRGPARQALSILAAKLPPAPVRVEVREAGRGIPNRPQPAEVILVYATSFDDLADVSPDDLVRMLLTGAGVRPCVNQLGLDPTQFQEGPVPQPNARYEDARRAAYLWLADRDPKAGGPDGPDRAGGKDPARQAVTALRALPADEQRARVAALRAAELTCAPGDRMDLLLTGTSGRR